MIEFNVEDRETLPKEDTTWQNLRHYKMRSLLLISCMCCFLDCLCQVLHWYACM